MTGLEVAVPRSALAPSPPLRSVSAFVCSRHSGGTSPTLAAFPMPPRAGRHKRTLHGLGLGLGFAPRSTAARGRICSAPARSRGDAAGGYPGTHPEPMAWTPSYEGCTGDDGGPPRDDAQERSHWSDSDSGSDSGSDASTGSEGVGGALPCAAAPSDGDGGAAMPPAAASGDGLVHPATPEEYAFLISAIDFTTLPPATPASELRSPPMARSGASPPAPLRKAASSQLVGLRPEPVGLAGPRAAASLSGLADAGGALSLLRSATADSMVTDANACSSSIASGASAASSLFSLSLSPASSRTSFASTCPSEPAAKPSVLSRGRPVPAGADLLAMARKGSAAGPSPCPTDLGLGWPLPAARQRCGQPRTASSATAATVRPAARPASRAPSASSLALAASCSASVAEYEPSEPGDREPAAPSCGGFGADTYAGADVVERGLPLPGADAGDGLEPREAAGGHSLSPGRGRGPRFSASQRDLLVSVWLAAEEENRTKRSARAATPAAPAAAPPRRRRPIARKLKRWFAGPRFGRAPPATAAAEEEAQAAGAQDAQRSQGIFEPGRVRRTRSIEQILFGPPS